jgi:hypothetical protein
MKQIINANQAHHLVNQPNQLLRKVSRVQRVWYPVYHPHHLKESIRIYKRMLFFKKKKKTKKTVLKYQEKLRL